MQRSSEIDFSSRPILLSFHRCFGDLLVCPPSIELHRLIDESASVGRFGALVFARDFRRLLFLKETLFE